MINGESTKSLLQKLQKKASRPTVKKPDAQNHFERVFIVQAVKTQTEERGISHRISTRENKIVFLQSKGNDLRDCRTVNCFRPRWLVKYGRPGYLYSSTGSGYAFGMQAVQS